MDFKVKVPEVHRARILLWTDVSRQDVEAIDSIQSIPALERALSSVLDVEPAEPQRGVLLQLYVQAVLFCRERSFNKEQTSVLLSIIKSVHEANTETPLNNMQQSFSYCRELLLCHSVRRPPFTISLFSLEEANSIFQYIYRSYMQHFKLYKYIFTPQVKLDLSLTYSSSSSRQREASISAVMEEETHVVPRPEESPETQETSITQRGETAFDSESQLEA